MMQKNFPNIFVTKIIGGPMNPVYSETKAPRLSLQAIPDHITERPISHSDFCSVYPWSCLKEE